MSAIMFEGDKKQGGIPRKAKVRVVSLPKGSTVFAGRATRAIALDLDPGHYAYSVTKLIGDKQILNYTGEFYHEIEPAAFEKLKAMRPQLCKPMHTSEGVRWRCSFPRCQEDEFTTQVSALLHEVSHFGIPEAEFLKNPDLSVLFDGQRRVEEYVSDMKKQAIAQGIVPADPLRLGSPAQVSRDEE